MPMEAVVADLNALGIFPFLDGDKLKTRSTGPIPEQAVALIREHKAALIAWLAGGGATSAGAAIAAAGAEGDRHPLSFAQRRLWFIDQLEGGSSQYNMPTALQLAGDVDLDAIEWALGEIVRRHAVL